MGTHGRHRGDQRLLVTALSSCKSTGSLLLSKFRMWRKLMRYSSFMATKTRIISKVKSFFKSVFLKGHGGHFICQDKGEKRSTYIVGEPVSTSTIVVSGESAADLKVADKGELIPQEKVQGIDAVSGESTSDLKIADKRPLIPQASTQSIVALKPFHTVKSPPAQKKKRKIQKRRRNVRNIPRQAAKGDISLLNLETVDVEMTAPFEGVVKASGDTSSVNLKRQALASIDNQPGIFPPPKRAALEYIPDTSTENLGSPMLETKEVDLPYSWIHNVNYLTEEHLATLTSTGYSGMLDDDIISMALEILQSQFDNFDGLQPPAALLVPGYSVVKKAVQIHYDVERAHWLTTCFDNGKILVADSISTSNLSPSIKQQICNIYSTVVPEPLRNLTFLNVDQQRNFYDCGVFTIAFAVEFLTTNGEPTARFQHEKMRDHLISCLQMGKISGFPRKAIG
ncbi:uncharacterized protein [Engystomops pustulosus]|uniref:uncharacterized protein n=1 Tax=Engystomops pustulosus TaxID=76066 RepID=UPI003AFA0B44